MACQIVADSIAAMNRREQYLNSDALVDGQVIPMRRWLAALKEAETRCACGGCTAIPMPGATSYIVCSQVRVAKALIKCGIVRG